jgi:chromosome segregation ATPase
MTPTPQPKSEPTLQDVLDQLSELRSALDEVRRKQDEMQRNLNDIKRSQDEMLPNQHGVKRSQDEMQRNQQQGQPWQDRTWDVVKWVGGISAGLAVSASIALVGIVLRQLV